MIDFLTDERKGRMLDVLAHRQPDLAVVMENVGDFHNIAAVMRTCDAVGVQDIYVVNTDKEIANLQAKGFKSSRSANRWITIYQFNSIEDCIKELRNKYDKIYSTHLSVDATSLYEMDFASQPTALVFGNEQHGVSDEMLSFCDGNFIIPQFGMTKSLNISVACAVTLYEAFRQKSKAGHYQEPKLAPEASNILLEKWSQKIR